MPSSTAKGALYEELAAGFLLRLGFSLVTANWRTRAGEVDLVAIEGDTLAFVEVRARSDQAGYLPEETVDQRKRRRIVAAAEAYLSAHPWNGPCRFDVVAIDIHTTGTTARLIRDAFLA